MKKQKIIPFNRPTVEPYAAYAPLFKKIFESGVLTNGERVRELERKLAAYIGVKHCVAVSSCSSGLMLAIQSLGLTGEIIMPSFTFGASGQPALWNNLTPVFADIDPQTFTLDPKSVEKCITKKTTAILATHVFGVVCDTTKLEALARKYKLKLIFDAAHAFGSTRGGKRVGSFGDVEVFSCTPIKILTAVEGGIVATNNDAIAEHCRLGRNYSDDGTNNMLFAGLSARMSELHAAVALQSFESLSKNLKKRRSSAQYLIKELKKVEPRLHFQMVPKDSESTYYSLSVYIDPSVLGYTRDMLHDYLKERGVLTRKYFFPPLHEQTVFKPFAPHNDTLPVTMEIAHNVLSMPLYSHIAKEDIDTVVAMFKEFTKHIKS